MSHQPAPPHLGSAEEGGLGLLSDLAARDLDRSRIASFVSLGQTLDLQARMGIGFGHEQAFKDLEPELRRQVERELSLARLLRFSGDHFDVKQLTDELEHLSDPAQRAAVLEDYELRSGHSLRAEIHGHTEDDSYHRAATDQLLSDDRARVEEKLAALAHDDPTVFKARQKQAEEVARRLVSELSKSDPDKKTVLAAINFTESAEDIELIRQAFRAIAPEQDGLFNRLNHALAGKDERQAIAALDMGPKRHMKQAAATLRNHTGDFAREARETLARLSPAEIEEMKLHPEEYGDILAEVQGWEVTPKDKRIIDAYIAGKRDLATGLQLAEDIAGGYQGEGWSEMTAAQASQFRAGGDQHLDDGALFAKLEAMKPEEREQAIAAYDAARSGSEQRSLRELMELRFHRDKDNYDRDRGVALLEGRVEDAMAALAIDAIDRKGTHLDDLEHALADPSLDPRLAESADPATVAAHQAALARRARIEQAFERYGKGTLRDLAHDEDKLAAGKDDRVAFDELLGTGSVGFAIEMQRAMDAGETEKAKERMLAASDEDLARARELFPRLEAGQGFDERIRLTWGPTRTEVAGTSFWGSSYKEVYDAEGDKSGTFIHMQAVLEKGARKGWSPQERARVDRQAHDADRDDPSRAERNGDSWAGSHYDFAIRREEAAAAEGLTGEEFAFHAENSDAAAGAYGKQKQAETEAFINHVKLAVTIAAAIVAPELLVVLGPLMSAAAIGYKEAKLGKHYEGERADWNGLAIDAALSAASLAGEALIAARQASTVARGIGAAGSEARTAAAMAQRLKLDVGRIAADNVARGVSEGKSWDEILKDVALGELQLGASRATSHLLGGVLQKIQGGGRAMALGKAAIMAGAQSATSVPFDAAMSGNDDFLRMFMERAANEGASGAHGVMAQRAAAHPAAHHDAPHPEAVAPKPAALRAHETPTIVMQAVNDFAPAAPRRQPFAAHDLQAAAQAVKALPGGRHVKGVIPDGFPPTKGYLHHSDAQKLIHAFDALAMTPTGQQTLAALAGLDVKITMERGQGTAFHRGKSPRINLDPTDSADGLAMAGHTAHETHHALTHERDVRLKSQGREEYVNAALRNEAEAESVRFRHLDELKQLHGIEHTPDAASYGEYHQEYDRVRDEYRSSGLPPGQVEALAREAATAKVQQSFAQATPSTAVMTDRATGQRVYRPGAARTYGELYARDWDSAHPFKRLAGKVRELLGGRRAKDPAPAPRQGRAPRQLFARHDPQAAFEVIRGLPGCAHFTGVVPDDQRPAHGQLRHSDAQMLIHAYDALAMTPSGQQTLKTIGDKGVVVTVVSGKGTSFRGGKEPRINFDPTQTENAFALAGDAAHEGHHAATFDRDVRVADQRRDEYVHAALRNEAESEAARFEHHRAMAQMVGGDHVPDVPTYAAYHGEYDRVAASYQAAGYPPDQVHAFARAAATNRVQEIMASQVPSTSIEVDEQTGERSIRPGAPRNYAEHYGAYWDSVAQHRLDSRSPFNRFVDKVRERFAARGPRPAVAAAVPVDLPLGDDLTRGGLRLAEGPAPSSKRFAGHSARETRAALDELPGLGHIEGVIPDDWPPVPGCLRLSDAQELLHTYELLGATPTGQATLRVIAERGVSVTMERGEGTFYADGARPRINLDRDTDPNAFLMAGAAAHEAHHTATLAGAVNVKTQEREEFKQAYLRNEAEAQAALFAHHREAAMLLGVDHGRMEGGHAEYHAEYARVVADQRRSGASPDAVRALAHEAGVRKLQEWFRSAVPSDSLMTDDATGRRVPRPGAPRTYDERMGNEWDEERAMRAVGELLGPEPIGPAPRRMAGPASGPSPLPADFGLLRREEHLAAIAAARDPGERLALWKEAHKIHSFRLREESLARTSADPTLGPDEQNRRRMATRNIWGNTLLEIDEEIAHLETTWGGRDDAEKHRMIEEVMARKQLELDIEMRHNVNIRNDVDQQHGNNGSVLHRPSKRRTWSVEELQMIDVSLRRLPAEHILGNRLLPPLVVDGVADPRTAGLQLRRGAMDHRWVPGQGGDPGRWSPRPATMGDHLDGVITAYDLAFTAPLVTEVDPLGGHFPGGAPGNGPVGLFETNIVHEIGHGVEFAHGASGTQLASTPGSASAAFREAGGWGETHLTRAELMRDLTAPGPVGRALGEKPAKKEVAALDKHRDSFNPVPTTKEGTADRVYQVDKYHHGDYLSRARGALPESAEDPLHRWDYARKHPAEAFAEQYQMAVHTPTKYHEDMVETPMRIVAACEAQLREAQDALGAAGSERKRRRAEAQVAAAESELWDAQAALTARGKQRDILRDRIFQTPAAVTEHKAVLEAVTVTTPIARIGQAWRIARFVKEAEVAMTPHQVATLAQEAERDIRLLP